jgi:hypothetical protein
MRTFLVGTWQTAAARRAEGRRKSSRPTISAWSGNDDFPSYESEVFYCGSQISNQVGWHQYFFNYRLAQWVDFYLTDGVSTVADRGWSLFETHLGSGMTCPTFSEVIGAAFLEVEQGTSTTWAAIPANSQLLTGTGSGENASDPECFDPNPPYYKLFYPDQYSWSVTDPAPTPVPTPTPRCPIGCTCNDAVTASHETSRSNSPMSPVRN